MEEKNGILKDHIPFCRQGASGIGRSVLGSVTLRPQVRDNVCVGVLFEYCLCVALKRVP
jgi:hypothetical protein